MPISSLAELRASLSALEADFDAGAVIDLERLRALSEPAKHWAAQSKDAHPIPRLARLFLRAKAPSTARGLLEHAHSIAPDSGTIALMLANIAAADGDHAGALAALIPLVDVQPADAALTVRAAELHLKLGNAGESVRLHEIAAAADGKWRTALLNLLIALQRGDQALLEARKVLAEGCGDAALCFASFKAFWKFSTNEDDIVRARKHFLEILPAGPSGALWRARLYRWEQDFEAALAELDAACAAQPKDPVLRKERAVAALALGYWGRDAGIIQDALAGPHDMSDLKDQLERADGLLRNFGGSLAAAASDNQRFLHVRSPESVFELVARETPAPRSTPSGRGLAMIAHSLTAGGAERIVAVTHRHLREDRRFDWVKLYLFNLSAEDGSDFYLPLTGIKRTEVVLLDRSGDVRAPFSFLPPEPARTAQAIYDRLMRDKPAIVHASLEPLTLYAGLAALKAQIPRIVLHTHNMRPTHLYPDAPQPPRWRDCYRSLLARDEIRLVGCAKASIDDYADWTGVTDPGKLDVVYNGLDFDQFRPAADPEIPAQLRAGLGIGRDAPVVGTAFKFRDEKRPLLWAETACAVLERRGDARFVMFGDGPLLEPTKAFVAARGMADRFVFPGLVSDLCRWLPMLDVFLLSSISEALPNVLLEAQAAGVPVVACHVGGIGETMIDGQTGILVETDSVNALASAVLRAIEDVVWRKSAALAGAAFVRERFSTESMLQSLTRILLS